MNGKKPTSPPPSRNIAIALTVAIQAALVVGLVLFVLRRDWENVFLTTIVVALTLLPALLDRRYQILIPPEFQLISAVFVFLGSAHDFYYRYWWWDVVLHSCSGFLLGVVGFVALFLLNRTDRIPRDM
jgi:hypothetical protein